jgi:hypothetical protein
MSDLFPEASGNSPRLQWLLNHGLRVSENEAVSRPLSSEKFVCRNAAHTYSAFGATEEEACVEYAAKFGLPHWSA